MNEKQPGRRGTRGKDLGFFFVFFFFSRKAEETRFQEIGEKWVKSP